MNAAVRVPVQHRQAQHDRLWVVDPQEVDAFAARFSAAPFVDAAVVPNTVHCMDFHAIASTLHLQQLGFAVQCAVGA